MMTLHGRKQDKGRQDNGRSCQHSKCLNKMAALEKKGLKHKWIKRYIKQNNLASSSLVLISAIYNTYKV